MMCRRFSAVRRRSSSLTLVDLAETVDQAVERENHNIKVEEESLFSSKEIINNSNDDQFDRKNGPVLQDIQQSYIYSGGDLVLQLVELICVRNGLFEVALWDELLSFVGWLECDGLSGLVGILQSRISHKCFKLKQPISTNIYSDLRMDNIVDEENMANKKSLCSSRYLSIFGIENINRIKALEVQSDIASSNDLCAILSQSKTLSNLQLFVLPNEHEQEESEKLLEDNNDILSSIHVKCKPRYLNLDSSLVLADTLQTAARFLQSLHLEGLGISPDMITLLASTLTRNTHMQLKRLNLGNNWLGSKSVQILCKALKSNTTLEELFLQENVIGPQGGKHLADMLTYTSTNTNEVTSASSSTSNTLSLRVLCLDCNLIGTEGANALVESMLVNSSLQRLCVSDNDISFPKIRTSIKKMLEKNTVLQEIDVSMNMDMPDQHNASVGVHATECEYLQWAFESSRILL
mmetsp:Transcript_29614/g.36599  ORF Transcript_29614/g.36599 Transcript_29614/m.36599 type:complete len:464 (+) Transcript_29614:393-1784(+)